MQTSKGHCTTIRRNLHCSFITCMRIYVQLYCMEAPVSAKLRRWCKSTYVDVHSGHRSLHILIPMHRSDYSWPMHMAPDQPPRRGPACERITTHSHRHIFNLTFLCTHISKLSQILSLPVIFYLLISFIYTTSLLLNYTEAINTIRARRHSGSIDVAP